MKEKVQGIISTTKLESAAGEHRSQLITNCQSLIEAKVFNASSMKTFIGNMIELIGGEESRVIGAETKSSIIDDRLNEQVSLLDADNNQEIRFSKIKTKKMFNRMNVNYAISIISPIETFPEEKEESIRVQNTIPSFQEDVLMGDDLSQAQISVGITYFSDKYKSYTGIEFNLPENKYMNLSLANLTGEQQRDYAKKVFQVWQGQEIKKAEPL